MDIEADLGIDSIKRVEILAAFEARVPSFKAVNPEHLGSLRTLRQIVEYGGGTTDAPASGPSVSDAADFRCDATCDAPLPEATRACDPSADDCETTSSGIQRRVLKCVDLPESDEGHIEIAPGAELWVTDDGTDLAPAIVRELQTRGCDARVVPISSESGTAKETGRLGGIVCLAPVVEAVQPCWDERSDRFMADALQLAGRSARALMDAATQGGAFFSTVSRMDGGFGLVGGTADPTIGGLAGLAKTASHEWPGVLCRALDVSATWSDANAAAAAIVRELTAQSPMEVGLDRLARRGLELADDGVRNAKSSLREGDVVVVTGGARGVTAAATLALAKRIKPTLVLLGRTPGPTDEPEWLVGVTDEAQIKRRILSRQYAASERPSPAQLESAFRRHMANREVLENLRRLESTGVQVVYQSVDVRQPAAVRAVLGEVRANVGPIRGIIHAAGVLEDRRIEDKSVEQFRLVWETKVGGLRSLLDATRRDELKLICLFSSVSARFGNAGQANYAMANEVLNKTAHRLAASRPDCRVVSINWGPWDGGMVGPELRRVFEKRGVGLIPVEVGAECMVDEVCLADRGAIEVVIGAGFESEQEAAASPAAPRQSLNESLTVAFERELDPDRHSFLNSHVLRGRPVLPVAISMEWMAHAALHSNPGLKFHGFDGFRLFKGVVVGDRIPAIRLAAGRIRRSDTGYLVDVELRGADAAGRKVLHAGTTVVLADALPPPPAFETPSDWDLQPYERSVESAYREVLFHGSHFHGIESVTGIGNRGIIARGRAAPPPAQWMQEPIRSGWICDPLSLDSAFQMAILWCHRHSGAVSLPSKLESYRQYVPAFPRDGVEILLEVADLAANRMRCDVTYVSRDGKIVARMGGYECTMDASLNAAFRSAPAVVARA